MNDNTQDVREKIDDILDARIEEVGGEKVIYPTHALKMALVELFTAHVKRMAIECLPEKDKRHDFRDCVEESDAELYILANKRIDIRNDSIDQMRKNIEEKFK